METYYFTFMGRQERLKYRYLKLHGSFYETRKKVLDTIGNQWAFQYDEFDFAPQIEEYGLEEISLDEAAEIING